jgi:hypothetical protein
MTIFLRHLVKTSDAQTIVPKKQSNKIPPKKICELTIVADHKFFADVGENSIEQTVVQMLWHVKEANQLIQSKVKPINIKSTLLIPFRFVPQGF